MTATRRWVDRSVSYSDCAEAFEDVRAGYDAARTTRYRSAQSDIPSMGANADWHYRCEGDYLRIMEWARGFDRNNCLAGQGVSRLIDNVLMGGPTLSPDTGDKGLDLELYNRVMAIASDSDRCDASGKFTLHELGALCCRAVIVDGDIMPIPLADRSIQVLEGHRPRTPYSTRKNVVHGVLVNDFGKPVQYWFTRKDIGFDQSQRLKVADIEPIDAYQTGPDGRPVRNVWHMTYPKRVSQTRGVSMLAPAFDYLGMHDDIQLAKLVQQQVASCFVFIRKKLPTQAAIPGEPTAPGQVRTESAADGSSRVVNVIGPGTELPVREDEEITPWTPNLPGQGWVDQAAMVLSIIAVNLNLPPMVFMLDPSSNFSGHRGAMEQARITYRRIQRMMVNRFYSPWYQWQVRWELANDSGLRSRAKSIGDRIFQHAWNPPAWPYLQPMEEAAARAFRRGKLLASPRMIAAEESQDWETLADHIVEDNVYLLRAAASAADMLTDEFAGKQTFTWQQILEPVPSGVTQNFVSPAQVTDQSSAPTRTAGGSQ